MINIKKVSKKYKNQTTKYALKNISLNIKKGDFLTIVGPSGSGKSTLLHLIATLDIPTSGTIKVNNKDINKLTDKESAQYKNKQIGLIFQDFKLQNHLTIIENAALPLLFNKEKKYTQKEANKKAKNLLIKLGLKNILNNKPNQISGGQKQRTAIARALINNPQILLADEPTGNLDTITGTKIIKLLKEIHKKEKITMIIVTHDRHIAKYASKIIEIKNGTIKNNNPKIFT